jgi:hypothetical protein
MIALLLLGYPTESNGHAKVARQQASESTVTLVLLFALGFRDVVLLAAFVEAASAFAVRRDDVVALVDRRLVELLDEPLVRLRAVLVFRLFLGALLVAVVILRHCDVYSSCDESAAYESNGWANHCLQSAIKL